MSNNKISSLSDGDSSRDLGTPANGGLSSDAMARRRMLLKSLSRGSAAVAAAAVPMHTLASTGTITNIGKDGEAAIRCGISGMMSSVHSRETFTQTCSGYSPGKYKKIENWPNYDPYTNDATNSVNGIAFNKSTNFNAIFGGGVNSGLLDIMEKKPSSVMEKKSSSDEFHWVCALLNAVGGAPASFYFPYTASQVVAFYKDTGPYSKAQALAFFKTYMEVHP